MTADIKALEQPAAGIAASPEMIAAAWAAWHSRHGGRLGPGPAFAEAIHSALAAQSALLDKAGEAEREACARIASTSSDMSYQIYPTGAVRGVARATADHIADAICARSTLSEIKEARR